MVGQKLNEFKLPSMEQLKHVSLRIGLPFSRFSGVDIVLGRNETGEVMGMV